MKVPYRLTGIDTDADAMALRKQTRSDLTTAIVGDLGTAQLPASSFDVIYCSYVLEHVKGVDRSPDTFSLAEARRLNHPGPGSRRYIRLDNSPQPVLDARPIQALDRGSGECR